MYTCVDFPMVSKEDNISYYQFYAYANVVTEKATIRQNNDFPAFPI